MLDYTDNVNVYCSCEYWRTDCWLVWLIALDDPLSPDEVQEVKKEPVTEAGDSSTPHPQSTLAGVNLERICFSLSSY